MYFRLKITFIVCQQCLEKRLWVQSGSAGCGSLLLLCLSTPAGAQAADDMSPLRPILCLALCFAPAQFHVSQLLLNCPLPCVLWSSSVSTTLRGPAQSFFSLYCCQLSSLCALSKSTSLHSKYIFALIALVGWFVFSSYTCSPMLWVIKILQRGRGLSWPLLRLVIYLRISLNAKSVRRSDVVMSSAIAELLVIYRSMCVCLDSWCRRRRWKANLSRGSQLVAGIHITTVFKLPPPTTLVFAAGTFEHYS